MCEDSDDDLEIDYDFLDEHFRSGNACEICESTRRWKDLDREIDRLDDRIGQRDRRVQDEAKRRQYLIACRDWIEEAKRHSQSDPIAHTCAETAEIMKYISEAFY